MPQRRPPTDSEPIEVSPEQLKAMDRYLDAVHVAYATTIAKLFEGGLPDWVPEPAVTRVRQAIASLQAADQSDARICEIVALERDCRLEIPDVRDPINFYDSVNYLAHVQWALGEGKAKALKELGGQSAAIGDAVRDQRRQYSARGNATKKEKAAKNAQTWLDIGAPLRGSHPGASNTWLARQIANRSGDKESTIRAALAELGLQKKKT